MPATQARIGRLASLRRTWPGRVMVFAAVALFLGWFYGWASPWCYPRNVRAGFGYGLLHGALMPMALPSLALGHDVEIYASNNSGRPYKLGYILGINACGLLFFGSAFWRPRSRPGPAGTE